MWAMRHLRGFWDWAKRTPHVIPMTLMVVVFTVAQFDKDLAWVLLAAVAVVLAWRLWVERHAVPRSD